MFPAQAGVIPIPSSFHSINMYVPRAGGGDPCLAHSFLVPY